jgi:transcriptional regulator with XRE-family HTH domain
VSGDAETREARLVTPGIDRPERDAFRLAFGQNLKSLRTAARISQETLAARCFLRNDNISRLERGGPPPRLELLLLLAETLGVSVGKLTEGLVTPTRAASLERMLALVAEESGSTTETLATSAGLSESYVLQDLRYLTPTRQIRYQSGRWETR